MAADEAELKQEARRVASDPIDRAEMTAIREHLAELSPREGRTDCDEHGRILEGRLAVVVDERSQQLIEHRLGRFSQTERVWARECERVSQACTATPGLLNWTSLEIYSEFGDAFSQLKYASADVEVAVETRYRVAGAPPEHIAGAIEEARQRMDAHRAAFSELTRSLHDVSRLRDEGDIPGWEE